jgi:type IV pilus assembly protein PilC
VKSSVESGSTFSDALRRHPKVFDELYVNLIHAGEVGGILDSILNRLSTYIEKAVKLKRQLKSALVYPSVVMLVAIIVVVVMLAKVIPVFENMYKEFRGAKLPAPTQFVIKLSNGFVGNWYIYAGVTIAIIIGLSAMLRTKRGRLLFDGAILRIPVIGGVLRKIVVARFTRTLGTMLKSGVPVLGAMAVVGDMMSNQAIAGAVSRIAQDVKRGGTIATSMRDHGQFPSLAVHMVRVGEETGRLEEMLLKVAEAFEADVRTELKRVIGLLEPIIILGMGVLVAFIVVAMLLAIFSINELPL